jgi:hypothetical protein
MQDAAYAQSSEDLDKFRMTQQVLFSPDYIFSTNARLFNPFFVINCDGVNNQLTHSFSSRLPWFYHESKIRHSNRLAVMHEIGKKTPNTT